MRNRLPYRERLDRRRGSPMGRHEVGEATAEPVRLRCRLVPLREGYDPGGAYWGERPPGRLLFCVYAPSGPPVVRWREAATYLLAEEAARRDFPNADFL